MRYHVSLHDLEADLRGLAAVVEARKDTSPSEARDTSRLLCALEDAADTAATVAKAQRALAALAGGAL